MVLGTNVQTGQHSNRFAGTLSLRSQFGSHVTNEWRGGLNGGTVLFFPDVSPGLLLHLERLPSALRAFHHGYVSPASPPPPARSAAIRR